jgi:hypothetical protein
LRRAAPIISTGIRGAEGSRIEIAERLQCAVAELAREVRECPPSGARRATVRPWLHYLHRWYQTCAMNVKGRLGASIGEVRDRGKRIAQLTLELAAAELKRKAMQFGAAFGLFGAAALFGFFFLAFLFAAVAAALALVLPVWAALLVTAGLLLVLMAVLVLVGVGLARAAKTPVPTQAVEQARADALTFRQGLQGVVRRKARSSAAPAAAGLEPVSTGEGSSSTSPGGADGQD